MERIAYPRLYASVTGTVLVLLGLFGFLASSEFDSPELTSNLFGFYPVNGWANAVHLAAGLIALALARILPRLYALLGATFFFGLGLWGVLAPNGEFLFGQLPATRSVNLFNLILGLLAALALIASRFDRIKTTASVLFDRLQRRADRRRRRHRERKLGKPRRRRKRPAAKPERKRSTPKAGTKGS